MHFHQWNIHVGTFRKLVDGKLLHKMSKLGNNYTISRDVNEYKNAFWLHQHRGKQ